MHYDRSLPLTLASDASPVGIGCVLPHVYPDGSERPIAFASRTLSGSKKKYSQIEVSSVGSYQFFTLPTDSETRSPLVPDRSFPRRSGRIRRPPERLIL
ncbi:uncharacterized protein K02A2.6 [Trichonephila clavipes]|nr:uncharacterized protein K02A2.6 [Trichonephila clavipes]